MIRFEQRGDFSSAERFLNSAKRKNFRPILERYGIEGVQALEQATPKDTSLTANSWGYEITIKGNSLRITWTNSHIVDGIPVVILIQYGHGTRSGTFVEGRDFINPTMRPIFDKISDSIWKEVTSL